MIDQPPKPIGWMLAVSALIGVAVVPGMMIYTTLRDITKRNEPQR